MRNLKTLLLFAAVASLIAGYSMQAFFQDEEIDTGRHLKDLFPDMQFSEKHGGLPHAVSADGAIAFNSYDITPSVRGYAGPLKVLVVLNPDGRIRGLRILDHKETKNYVHYMESPEYLQRFAGKSIRDPFEVDRDVDGISRATVSVQALAETVRKSSRAVAAEVLGISVEETGGQAGFAWGWLSYLLLFSFSLSAYYLSRKDRRYLSLRDACLIAGTGVVGIFLSSPFSILHIFNLLLLRPSSSLLWLTIMTTTALSVALAGRFYCGWLCPFGAVAEFIGRLPARKWIPETGPDDMGRDLKYVILLVAAIAVFLSWRPDFGNYETYITLFSLHGNPLAWALVIFMLAVNLRVRRFWCRYLCPVAAVTGLLSRSDPRYVSSPDCPMGNKPMPLIAECIRCNRCYKKEAEGQIH